MKDCNYGANVNDLLNTCIEVESISLDRRTTIPHQICFCLNPKTIAAIDRVKAGDRQFKLSRLNLATLRCYAIFNLPLESRTGKSFQSYLSQSSLTFSTQYERNKPNAKTLLRSTIDLQGKISQQIERELVHNPPLLERVSEAHYWLTNEILSQLPFESKGGNGRLLYSCLAIATFATCSLICYCLPLSPAIELIICLSIVSAVLLAIALGKHLKLPIIQRLAREIFSPAKMRRQLSLKILNFLL